MNSRLASNAAYTVAIRARAAKPRVQISISDWKEKQLVGRVLPCFVYFPNVIYVTLVMGAGKGSGGENYVNPVVKYMLFFSHIIFWVSRLRLLVGFSASEEREGL